MDKKSYSTIVGECDYSEFGDNGYDCSVLTQTIRKLVEESSYAKEDIVFVLDRLMESIDSSDCKYINNNIAFFHKLKYIDSTEEDQVIHVGQQINAYLRKVRLHLKWYTQHTAKAVNTNNTSLKATNDFLDSFFDLSKNVIFSPHNFVLNNESFRKSDFLQDLIMLFAHPIPTKRRKHFLSHYRYSMFDPFAHDTLQRIAYNIVAFREDLCFGENPDITKLLQELFLRRAERAFNRFLFYQGRTYRVTLNRHDSLLYASPYEDLSSIEEIKPIRLFEKIAMYIQKNLVQEALFNVKICIIGHSEKSASEKESEWHDLLSAVLYWYSKNLQDQYPTTKLNLNIINYINENDCPRSNFDGNRTECECEIHGNSGQCTIEKINYTDEFCFNTKKINELIDQNNIVFVLDCPWLTTENYEIKKFSSMDFFCRALQDRERRDIDLKNKNAENLKSADYLESNFVPVYKDLDSQYNRLMASKTLSAGEIVRVFNDGVVKKIEKKVRNYDSHKKKELYIFSSESDGLTYSYTSTYPLVRRERYEGKNITIIKFSNDRETMLKIAKSRLCFKIRLWSILKYLSVSFAYIPFKEKIQKCFQNCSIGEQDYFEIYRSISIWVEVEEGSETRVSLSLHFCDYIEELLRTVTDSAEQRATIQRELYDRIRYFINELYGNIVFSKNTGFFTQSIKTGFLMNIYSAIKNVEEMIFWHKMRMNVLHDAMYEINVCSPIKEYDEIKNIYCADEGYAIDFFADKKIYDAVLLALESLDELSIGIRSMLADVSDIYFVEDEQDDIQKVILTNICAACKNIGATDFNFYKNAKNILED